MDATPDQFRYCVHCGADCDDDDPEHALDCPFTTGVWPVREEEAFRCPACGANTRELCCMDCDAPLVVGDHYMLRDAETGEVGGRPDVGEVICLGCAARIANG